MFVLITFQKIYIDILDLDFIFLQSSLEYVIEKIFNKLGSFSEYTKIYWNWLLYYSIDGKGAYKSYLAEMNF